jgi:hypothetical protein
LREYRVEQCGRRFKIEGLELPIVSTASPTILPTASRTLAFECEGRSDALSRQIGLIAEMQVDGC